MRGSLFSRAKREPLGGRETALQELCPYSTSLPAVHTAHRALPRHYAATMGPCSRHTLTRGDRTRQRCSGRSVVDLFSRPAVPSGGGGEGTPHSSKDSAGQP